MTPEALKRANDLDAEIEKLHSTIEEWEDVTPKTQGGVVLNARVTIPGGFIPPAAWNTFKRACQEAAQRELDAKRKELADL